MMLPLLPLANMRFGFGNSALDLTVPVEVLICRVRVSILPFSSYTAPLTSLISTVGKLLISTDTASPSAFWMKFKYPLRFTEKKHKHRQWQRLQSMVSGHWD